MTLLVDRSPSSGTPVHVLVVVVGKNMPPNADLHGAGNFAGEIAEFWRDAETRLPGDQRLSTIDVLASDPSGAVSILDDSRVLTGVDTPTFDKCREALLDWAALIADPQRPGVGVLHWIGHGRQLAEDGGIVDLFVDSPQVRKPEKQDGLDWTGSLYTINDITQGRPVYCFIDACRSADPSSTTFGAIDRNPNSAVGDNAIIFQSCPRGQESTWLARPTQLAVDHAGCRGEAMATRAFLAALQSFGARATQILPGTRYNILAAELNEGASALLKRWQKHEGLSEHGTEGPRATCSQPILLTDTPMSVVDVHPSAAQATQCMARSINSSQIEPSETSPAPFQFRLLREPHMLHFDDGSHRVIDISYPHVEVS